MWGRGTEGQLGYVFDDGKICGLMTEPRVVDHFKQKNLFVTDVSLGRFHTLAIARPMDQGLESRRIYAFGMNNKGQCGFGDTAARVYPKMIDSLQDEEAHLVATGELHSIFATRKDVEESKVDVEMNDIDHELATVGEKPYNTTLYACGTAAEGVTGLTTKLKGCFKKPLPIKQFPPQDRVVKLMAGTGCSFALVNEREVNYIQTQLEKAHNE